MSQIDDNYTERRNSQNGVVRLIAININNILDLVKVSKNGSFRHSDSRMNGISV